MEIKQSVDIAIKLIGFGNWLTLDNKYDLELAKKKWVSVDSINESLNYLLNEMTLNTGTRRVIEVMKKQLRRE